MENSSEQLEHTNIVWIWFTFFCSNSKVKMIVLFDLLKYWLYRISTRFEHFHYSVISIFSCDSHFKNIKRNWINWQWRLKVRMRNRRIPENRLWNKVRRRKSMIACKMSTMRLLFMQWSETLKSSGEEIPWSWNTVRTSFETSKWKRKEK